MSELKKTSVFDEYDKYGAKIVEFGGFSMPIQFSHTLSEEHRAVREGAGLFDVSHMGEVFVTGGDALRFLNYIFTNDLTALTAGSQIYTMMCYENGGIVDDLMIYYFGGDKYCIVTNASNTDKDFKWMIDNKGDFDVVIENCSDNISQLALQGPYAEGILQKFTDSNLGDIANLKFMENVVIAGKTCMVSRSGYTGEDGFEIYCKNEDAPFLWNKILTEGEFKGSKAIPIGLGARDTLRFECAMPLYGNELSADILAVETGINFCIKLNKEDFIGKAALVAAKADLKRKIVGLELLDKGVPRHGYEIERDGKKIGVITTGYIPPTVNKAVAMAYVDAEYSKLGEEVTVLIRNKLVKAKVVAKKFYDRTKK